MPQYLITFPNGTTRTETGTAIRTQSFTVQSATVNLVGHLAIPNQGYPRQTILTRLVAENPGSFWQTTGNPAQWCKVAGVFNFYDGNCRIQQFYSAPSGFWNYLCGSFYYVPGLPLNCGASRCDLIITRFDGTELVITGIAGQSCPTWVVIADDCPPNQIKCPDPFSPNGYCCIPCDSLVTRIRALML